MDTLSHHDILALNRAIGEIYTTRDLESFYQATFIVIHGMIPYDLCSYNDVSRHPGSFLRGKRIAGRSGAGQGRVEWGG